MTYNVKFTTNLELCVTIKAPDEGMGVKSVKQRVTDLS